MLFILSDSGIKLFKKLRQNQYVDIKFEFIRHTVISLLTLVIAIISSFVEVYVSTNFLYFFKEIL